MSSIDDKEKKLYRRTAHTIENHTELEVIKEESDKASKMYYDPNHSKESVYPILELCVARGEPIMEEGPDRRLETIAETITEHLSVEWVVECSNPQWCTFESSCGRHLMLSYFDPAELEERIYNDDELPHLYELLGRYE